MAADSSSPAIESVELPEIAWLRQPALPFDVRLARATDRIAVVVLQGVVDAPCASRFRDVVTAGIDQGAAAMVVDLSAVSFIDSVGLGAIVLAARRLGPGGIALVLPHRGLVRIFRVCGLDRLLDICETREQALRAVRHPSLSRPNAASYNGPRREPASDATADR
jgi:anti-sigma B factor antagonist